MKYVIITPAYNEENYISKTIQSVINQTIKPAEWIIIDDGSSDKTAEVVEKYLNNCPWIKFYKKGKSNSEFGANVVQNFYYGYERLQTNDWDFIAKLDADLDLLRDDYFEYQMNAMLQNSKLGLTSGITFYTAENGEKKEVWHPEWRTTGAMKFYRRACWEDIGGIIPIFGWDGIDEYKAMYNGWITKTFYELKVHHLAKHVSFARYSFNYFHNKGISLYRRGFSFTFVLLKSLQWIKRRNKIAFYGLLKGFTYAYKQNMTKIVSKDEIKFIRKFQVKRFFKIK